MKINSWVAYALAFFVFALYVFSLYNRIPHIDDAWLGEQVYWFDKENIVKNVLMKHFFNSETGLIAYHKLFIWAGLGMVKVFGFSLIALKSTSLISLIVFLSVYYYYTVHQRKLLKPSEFILVAALFVIQPLVFEFSFVFRPEIMLMNIGFISFAFLERSKINKKNRVLFVLLSAITTGIAVLVHLNGLVFIVAGFFFLIYREQYKDSAIYISVSVLVSSLYFLHFNSISDFTLWLNLIVGPSSNSLISYDIFNIITKPIIKLTNEHLRLFHSSKEISLTILLIGIIVLGFTHFKKRTPGLLLYILLMFVSIAILTVNKTSKYGLIYYPYLVLLLIFFAKNQWKSREGKYVISNKWKPLGMFVLLLVFIATSLIYNINLSIRKFSPAQNKLITDTYVKTSLSTTKIMTPMPFIFNEIDRYGEIVSLMSYHERMKTETTLTGSGFFNTANEENIDYILINDSYWDIFKLPDTTIQEQIPYYNIIGRNNGLIMLENEKIDNK